MSKDIKEDERQSTFSASIVQNKKIGLALLASIVLLTVAFMAGYELGQPADEKTSEVRLGNSQFKFINPLLDYQDNTQPLLPSDIEKLKEGINSIIGDAKKHGSIKNASVYYRDLNNGPWFAINREMRYRPASLLKIPILIAVLKIAETDPTILQKEIVYQKAYENVPQHNIAGTLSSIVLGETYTMEELLSKMITESDNVATLLIQDSIDSGVISQVYNDFAIPSPDISLPSNMTVIEYAGFLRVLYNSTYLSQKHSEYALSLLSKTQFKDGLVADLPPRVVVSHKFGVAQTSTSERQLHDCGIVYDANNNYLVCVMTIGDEYSEMSKTVKDISSAIYRTMHDRML